MTTAATAARIFLAFGLTAALLLPARSRAADVASPPPSPGGESVYSEESPALIERVACPAPAGGPATGSVLVRALVDKDGSVRDCKVEKSVPGLDETALACVRQYRFETFPRHWSAAAVWIRVPVRFGVAEEIPVAVSKVLPKYPDAARDGRIQGLVVVQALVDREGRVARTRVKVSIPGLDEAAIRSIGQWRFRPARVNGAPVAMWLDVPVRFSIH